MKLTHWALICLFCLATIGCDSSADGVVESSDEVAEQAEEDAYNDAQEAVVEE